MIVCLRLDYHINQKENNFQRISITLVLFGSPGCQLFKDTKSSKINLGLIRFKMVMLQEKYESDCKCKQKCVRVDAGDISDRPQNKSNFILHCGS